MNLSHWIGQHRRSLLLLIALLALGGAAAAFLLPVAMFPAVDFPRVRVSFDSGDRPAEQMVAGVTKPVEQAIRAVPGVTGIKSTSSRGGADLDIDFAWGSDMPQELLQVDTALNQLLPSLPAGTSFTAIRMSPSSFPVAAYSLISSHLDLVALRRVAVQQLVPLLSPLSGVAQVQVIGGETPEYQVDLDPARAAATGVSLNDVATAVTAANSVAAVGRVDDHDKLLLVTGSTPITSLDQIRQIPVKPGIILAAVAHVHEGTEPQVLKVTAQGTDAVTLQIYQQPGGNTVQVVNAVNAALADYKPRLPPGIQIGQWYDESKLVTASAGSVRDAILFGVVLAAVVLLLFLRNIRITIIAMIVVPAVLASTALLLLVAGMSFNIMTLGGMAAAIGLIVDDAIVMIEHLIRRLQENAHETGGDRNAVIRRAAAEFTRPLVGSSASTIIIFVPLAFLSGVTGAFFKALAMTMASALAMSFLVAWLAVPLMVELLLRDKDAHAEEEGPATRRVLKAYRSTMGKVLTRPWLVLLLLVPLLGGGWLAYSKVGSGFMPEMDEGNFNIDYRAPDGTSLAETDRLLRQMEQIIDSMPEISAYSRRTGAQFGGGLTEANHGDIILQLKPQPRRSITAVMDDLRDRVADQVPGLDLDMAQLIQDRIGDLTDVPQPIEIELYGTNTDELVTTAPMVADAIGKVTGVVDVDPGVVLAGDALEIKVNPAQAALEGLTPDAVTTQVAAMLDGTVATQVQKSEETIGVRVWLPASLRASPAAIGNLSITAPDGHLVPVNRVATLVHTVGQPEITRANLRRMVAVTARISGRDLGSTIVDVRKTLTTAGLLPNDVTFELGGLYKQQQIAFRGLIAVFAAAVALVFLLLLYLYESFRVALAIMTAPMLAAAAVFIGLWATGIELNISAMMGMTMVIGIVTEIAIFYFSEYHQLVEEGMPPAQALIEAGANRLRPIAMTTLAAILALMPLAFALGQGAGMQQPLAVAIISGLLVQIPLVLVVMPVMFRLIAVGRLGESK